MSATAPGLPPGQHFFAEFGFDGSPKCLVRKDTRIYLHPQNPASIVRAAGRCAGVIWMCNPGSAGKAVSPCAWRAIQPDPTLRAVLTVYRQAAHLKCALPATGSDDPLPGRDKFILVMNCYYSVDQNSTAAYGQWITSGCGYRERIPKKARFVVAAWGSDKPDGPVWRAIQRIRRRRKKMGSALLVVYIDAPLLRGGAVLLRNNLAMMNYPLHPLNPQFNANSPKVAAVLAPFL